MCVLLVTATKDGGMHPLQFDMSSGYPLTLPKLTVPSGITTPIQVFGAGLLTIEAFTPSTGMNSEAVLLTGAGGASIAINSLMGGGGSTFGAWRCFGPPACSLHFQPGVSIITEVKVTGPWTVSGGIESSQQMTFRDGVILDHVNFNSALVINLNNAIVLGNSALLGIIST